MDFKDYQQQAHKTASYPQDKAMSYLVSGLGSEAGEVMGKYAKFLRGDKQTLNKKELLDEIGDVLWFVAEICNHLEVDMSEVADNNLKKLKSRQKRNLIKGSGDNR